MPFRVLIIQFFFWFHWIQLQRLFTRENEFCFYAENLDCIMAENIVIKNKPILTRIFAENQTLESLVLYRNNSQVCQRILLHQLRSNNHLNLDFLYIRVKRTRHKYINIDTLKKNLAFMFKIFLNQIFAFSPLQINDLFLSSLA